MNLQQIETPFNFILFGASGDLASLHIFPALYELVLQKRFSKSYSIVGFGRSAMTDEEFRDHIHKSLRDHVDKLLYNETVAESLIRNAHYHQGEYDDPKTYNQMAKKLLNLHGGQSVRNLAYLAVPPVVFEPIVQSLAGIRGTLGRLNLMMEKPFGHDYTSAEQLFSFITSHFSKADLFLIDHYLGKAPVQSILPLRYNNTVLNLLLKGGAIANIQISALETIGVEERIGYFDQVGIVKDMIQSHLLQVLALLTMAMPVHPSEQSVRREKGNILSALRYSDVECGAVLGQYASYVKQKDVEKISKTPTFAAFRFFIDMTDWYKVPIYIRTGKKLSHKHTYVVIEFKKPPFQESNQKLEPNRLIIELFPHEDIEIRLVNDVGQVPKSTKNLISQESLACMGDDCLPAYGRLILDAFLEKRNSFLSIDEVYASWHFVDELMSCVKKRKSSLIIYPDGDKGPQEQYDLTKQDGFEWYDPDKL